jgi:hypothetical protein
MYQQQTDVIYIGADVHERETQLAIFEPSGTLLQEERIATKDLQSFVQALPAKEKHLALESSARAPPMGLLLYSSLPVNTVSDRIRLIKKV